MTTHSTHWHGTGPDAVSVPGTVEDCAACGGYCIGCPDHEACFTGYPCDVVRDIAARSAS